MECAGDARDTAIEQNGRLHDEKQQHEIYEGRERHLGQYAVRCCRRRRDHKVNSLCGLALSTLTLLTVTQVSRLSGGGPVSWQYIQIEERIQEGYMALLPVPPIELPEPEPAREAASRQVKHDMPAENGTDAVSEEKLPAADQANAAAWTKWGPALKPAAMPVMEPQTVRLMDSTAVLTSAIRLISGPEMPDARGLDEAPKLLAESINVRYPWRAIRNGIQGLVVVHFFVDPDGRASNVRVLESLSPDCDEEAVKAIQRARFRPGLQGGKKIGTYSRIGVRFVLN